MMPTDTRFVNPSELPPGTVTDCHFHVFPEGAVAVAGARYAPRYGASLAQWASGGRSGGVARGVVVQPSFLGHDNSCLLETLRAAPSVLRGVAVVAPGTGAAELQAMHAAGVRGIRLNLVGTEHRIEPGMEGLFERIHALGWHVELHSDLGRMLTVLRQMPPELTLVLDHFGKPAQAGELGELVHGRQDRLFVKLSAPYRLSGPAPEELGRRWLALLGPERLLWGSDWPCTAHEERQRSAQHPGVLVDWLGDADAVLQVLCRTPAVLYGFD